MLRLFVNYFQAIILGLVEGATEFLPVSSTFHLIWTGKLIGTVQSEFLKTFEVFIQSGAIAAVLFLYLKYLLENKRLMGLVLAAFLPTASVGLLLYKIIKGYFFENNYLQLFVFIGVGIVFILYEWLAEHKKNQLQLNRLTLKQALIVGFAQALAVVPGVSRAGAVLLVLMMLRFRRDEAAKFSFLLAVPTIFAAASLDLVQTREIVFNHTGSWSLLFVGLVTAFISALVVIRWFIRYLSAHSLAMFGWYRIVLGIYLLSLLFLTR